MKIDNYEIPKSSFLSIEKDFDLIIKKILQSERLKKLLYYNTADALKRPSLTQNQTLELIKNNIKIVPKYYIDNNIQNYIVITFDDFSPNGENPEFRDNLIMFDIVCHVEQWALQDYQLRPYKIAGEIDFLLNNKRLTGIGKTEFIGCHQVTVNADYISLCLAYRAVHGEEDKKGSLNPQEWENFVEEFDLTYNDK